jgi:spore coat polysaccharide biosynthesis protein SpsF
VKVAAVIQARLGSSRLPGKVLREIEGRPLLGYVLERLDRCSELDERVVATTTLTEDDAVAGFCAERAVRCHRGSSDDVLGRVLGAAEEVGADAVVRVSGDSPLLDPELVDTVVSLLRHGDADAVTNVFPRSYPPGQSVEALRVGALRAIAAEAGEDEREHVTTYLYRHPERFAIENVLRPQPLTEPHLAVDTAGDLERVRALVGLMRRPHWEYGLDELAALHQEIGAPA